MKLDNFTYNIQNIPTAKNFKIKHVRSPYCVLCTFDIVTCSYMIDIVTATSNVDNFGMYKRTIFNIFNRHVPIKKKYIRANEAPFMSKELHKAIMKRSR